MASLGRNLPMTDCDFMITKTVVFGYSNVVAGAKTTSRCACSLKQCSSFLIDSHCFTQIVANPNACTSFRRAEFDGPDGVIERLQVVFGCFIIFTRPVILAQQKKRSVVIFQTPCLKLVHIFQM